MPDLVSPERVLYRVADEPALRELGGRLGLDKVVFGNLRQLCGWQAVGDGRAARRIADDWQLLDDLCWLKRDGSCRTSASTSPTSGAPPGGRLTNTRRRARGTLIHSDGGRWQGSSRRSTTSTKLKAARARRWRNAPRCCAQVAGGGACAAQRTAQPRAPRSGRRHHAARGTAGDRSTRPAPPRSRPHPAPGAVQRRGGSTTAKTRVAVCRCFTICTDGTETEARPVRAEKQKRPE